MKKKLFVLNIIFLFTVVVYPQNLDSLKFAFKNAKTDSLKVKLCSEISLHFGYSNLDSAFYYAKLAESKLNNLSNNQKSSVFELFGILNSMKGRNDKALEYFLKQLKISEENNYTKQIAKSSLNVAFVFQNIEKYQQMFTYFEKALSAAKKIKDSALIDKILSNGSDFYFNRGNYEKALQIWNGRLFYNPKIKDDIWFIAGIGDIYRAKKQYNLAEKYYNVAINKAIQQNDSSSLIILYNNYALIPELRGDINLAIKYFKHAKEIALRIKDDYNQNDLNNRIAQYYIKINDFESALPFINEAIVYFELKKQTNTLAELYELKSITLKGLNDYRGAYEYLVISNSLKEELSSQDIQNKISKLESEVIQEEKDKEILLVNKDLDFQKRIRNIFIFGAIVFIFLSIIVFRSLRLNKRKSEIISNQKLETEKQKHLIEEKQKEIIDSITYAKRLQDAILPPKAFVDSQIDKNFIYYKPKDIVAGDFYWAEKVGNLFFIAAADSTGHGVPGALVSVVCSNALNRSIKEFSLIDTGKILDKTRDLVLETFEKSSSDVKDGMDISLLCIDNKNKIVCWSGANNPLWYIQNNELKEIKADKQPIGKTETPKPFTTHRLEYKENTTFYLFTDGFADQFGGVAGKKFKYKNFSSLLLKNYELTQNEQHAQLNAAFNEWKGDLEQVDDVCVIGIKL